MIALDAAPGRAVRKVQPIDGWQAHRAGGTMAAMLELALLALTALSFLALDRYVAGCERL